MKYPHHDEEWLRERGSEGLTIDEMMDKAGVTKKEKFRVWLDRYGVCPSDCIKCPNCDSIVQSAGRHWNQGGCGFPEIDEEKWELLKGLVMGDGCVHHTENSTNPHFIWQSISYEHMLWFHQKMGWLSTGMPVLFENGKAEAVAQDARRSGFSPNASAENYSDQYTWYSVSHPKFENFIQRFYPNDKKKFPSDLEISPRSLKIWYCGDGTFESGNSNQNIAISIWNERDNTEKISQMFKNSGLPTPSVYIDSEANCKAQFTKGDSEVLWNYMGQPLPGFEYKWPDEFK